jgi:antitoxin YefM
VLQCVPAEAFGGFLLQKLCPKPSVPECKRGAYACRTRRKARPVVMMSLDDYNSIQETGCLLRNPANAERLPESLADMRKGNVAIITARVEPAFARLLMAAALSSFCPMSVFPTCR